jgi:hypothetical protein
MKRQKSGRWAGLWAFAIVLAYFLLGLFGHYANTAINHAP